MTRGPVTLPVWLGLTTAVGLAALAPVSAQPPAGAPVPGGCAAVETVPDVNAVAARDAALPEVVRCVCADVEAGRWRAADARLRSARAAASFLAGAAREAWLGEVARLEALRQVDTGRWDGLTDFRLPDEAVLPWIGPLVRGVAAARLSWAQQDAGLQARARAELQALQRLAAQAGPLSDAERAKLIVQGAMAGAQYERDEMQLLLEAAHDLEIRLYVPDGPRTPIVLAWEVEADLLRITDRYAAASERYRDLLVEWPRRVQARVGLAAAYRRLGYEAQADETLAQARTLWADADPEALGLLR